MKNVGLGKGYLRFLLKCPYCGKQQHYIPRAYRREAIGNKRRKCVVCSRSFLAREHIVREL